MLEQSFQVRLRGHELREDDGLLAVLGEHLVERIEEDLDLCVLVLQLGALGEPYQVSHLGNLGVVIERGSLHGRLVAILDVGVAHVGLAHVALLGALPLQRGEASLERLPHGRRAAGHHALHDDEQEDEAHVLASVADGLVVRMGHIVGYALVELLLQGVPVIPADVHQVSHAVLEKRVSLVVDGLALLRTDEVGSHLGLHDRLLVGEGLAVEQAHEPQKRLGLAVVRRGGKEQQVGTRLGEELAQLVARHVAR